MSTSVFINQHILGSVRAAVAEVNGDEREASRLNAHTKLRLLMMTDEDLTDLAELMARHSGKSIEKIRKELDEVIAQYQAMADTWVSDVFGTPSNSRSGC